ncbi:sulfatase-like hydrolase/transferase [Methylotuvimicrobium sp.]|uniref:sulfatase-like hydrolase/transferase n=1 Tax=Methylotuvimicrobium sp. TaxID=2822413 RepID=UPI003D661114
MPKFPLSLEKLVWRHRRLVSVITVVAIIQLFELALLQVKYDIFIGGFLQPYAYLTLFERLGFILLTLWYDFILFGLIGVAWFYIADRLNKSGILIYYSFTVLILLSMGVWLGLKFKVLSYFNDTINYQIIANLGGGSLRDGLLYAANEIVLFAGTMAGLIVLFILIARFLKNHHFIRDYHKELSQSHDFKWTLTIMTLISPFLTYAVSDSDYWRYGLSKKTSYNLITSGFDQLTDFDRDGYGLFGYPKDTAPFDKRIYPGALDIPGNRIDEDGIMGDAQLVPLTPDPLRNIKPRPGKHIILIVLETARFDLLEQCINGRYVAPVMREVARTGTSVDYAYSHTGYTTTSLMAIFNRELIHHDNRIKLLDFLKDSGYGISIISGQDESFGDVATFTGMNKTSNYYFDARTAIDDRVFPSKDSGSLRLSEERVVEQFLQRFTELDFSQPQFIYLNFQAAHFPYSHPNMQKILIDDFIPRSEIRAENRERVAETYWNAIANADWAVGQVVEMLKSNKLYDQTTLVILGDHGESLFEDGFLGHGHAISDAQTHIPLVFNDPNIEVPEAIGQIDVVEMAIRSAFGLPNQWLDEDKTVFQLVGNLKLPALIGHVKYGGDRIVFDFRTKQAFLSDLKQWKPYQDWLKDPQQKERMTAIIREWENLKWHEFEYRQRTKFPSVQSFIHQH